MSRHDVVAGLVSGDLSDQSMAVLAEMDHVHHRQTIVSQISVHVLDAQQSIDAKSRALKRGDGTFGEPIVATIYERDGALSNNGTGACVSMQPQLIQMTFLRSLEYVTWGHFPKQWRICSVNRTRYPHSLLPAKLVSFRVAKTPVLRTGHYSTVTLLARFLGWSTSVPLISAA